MASEYVSSIFDSPIIRMSSNFWCSISVAIIYLVVRLFMLRCAMMFFWIVSAQLNQFVKIVRHASGFLWLLRLVRECRRIAIVVITARLEERITEDGQLASIAIPVCVRVRECHILIFRNVYCIWQTFKMCPYVTLVAL